MKVLYYEHTTRYYCSFEQQDATKLKLMGLLPPDAAVPAHWWLTRQELDTTLAQLGITRPVDEFLKDVPEAGAYLVAPRGKDQA